MNGEKLFLKDGKPAGYEEATAQHVAEQYLSIISIITGKRKRKQEVGQKARLDREYYKINHNCYSVLSGKPAERERKKE